VIGSLQSNINKTNKKFFLEWKTDMENLIIASLRLKTPVHTQFVIIAIHFLGVYVYICGTVEKHRESILLQSQGKSVSFNSKRIIEGFLLVKKAH
jgi:hypothetical protein